MYSSLKEQAKAISEHFGKRVVKSIDLSDGPSTLPDGAERNFVIPSWRGIAPTYPEAVALAIAALKKDRGDGFLNWKEDEIDAAHLRQLSPRDLHGVYAAQLGSRHRGKSVGDARRFFDGRTDEAALGAYEAAMILLSNPGIKLDGAWWGIDCAADEWSYGGDGVFSFAPVFYFGDDRLRFGACVVSRARDYSGSGSLFVPQPALGSPAPLDSSDPSSLEARVSALEADMGKILRDSFDEVGCHKGDPRECHRRYRDKIMTKMNKKAKTLDELISEFDNVISYPFRKGGWHITDVDKARELHNETMGFISRAYSEGRRSREGEIIAALREMKRDPGDASAGVGFVVSLHDAISFINSGKQR